MRTLSLRSLGYRRLTIATLLGLLAGCAVKPVVQYTKIIKPVDMVGDEIDSFSLRATEILIEQLEPKKDADPKAAANFSISSVPVAYGDYKVGMRKADSWGVSTNLTLVKLENTSLIKEIGVDVVDSRADLLAKYGGIIVKLIALVPFDSSQLNSNALPKRLNVTVLLNASQVQREAVTGIDAADGVTLDIGALPVDAKPASDYQFPVTLSGIMYPACRNATVKFKYKDHTFEKALVISDPRYLSYIAFPKTGKVTFHSECGVSQTSNKAGADSSAVNIADVLLVQGKAIKEAIDAANKKK